MSAESRLRIDDRIEMPFAAIYVDGQRTFDVELWANGNLIQIVPPQTPATEEVYDRIDSADRTDGLNAPEAPVGNTGDLRREIEREMISHPGAVAALQWKNLRRMASVHRQNASELSAVVHRLTENVQLAVEMVQNVNPRTVREAVEAELDQRLHNYVSSTTSLIDQTRRLMNGYPCSSIAAAYVDRKDKLVSVPVVGFMRCLRNFVLHRALPFVGYTLKVTQQDWESQVRLSTKTLREWDGWTALATQYLDQSGEAVDLRSAVDDHISLFDELWSWLFAQYIGLHRLELLAYDELVEEYNWLLSRGTHGRPRRPWAMLTVDGFAYVPR